MVATAGQYWLGAKQMNVGDGIGGWQVGEYVWTEDFSPVDNGNWETGYPLSGLVNFSTNSLALTLRIHNNYFN